MIDWLGHHWPQIWEILPPPELLLLKVDLEVVGQIL
jgi:hypothetical protein